MDRSPYDFTMNASRNELLPLLDFVHRTFNGGDCIDFIGALRGICLRDGSLGGYFKREYAETGDLRTVLSRFRTAFWSADHRPRAERARRSSIDRGASWKRLRMYLKWMVRDDGRGVDFGLWKSIPPAALYLPLDVHTGHMGRALGLLVRKQRPDLEGRRGDHRLAPDARRFRSGQVRLRAVRRRDRRIPEIESLRKAFLPLVRNDRIGRSADCEACLSSRGIFLWNRQAAGRPIRQTILAPQGTFRRSRNRLSPRLPGRATR